MKKCILTLVLAMVVAGGVSAQEAAHKHDAGDMLLGLNWSFFGAMMNANPMNAIDEVQKPLDLITSGSSSTPVDEFLDLPKFFVTARILNIGLSYEYYLFNWLSIGTGLGFGPEVNLVTKGGKTEIKVDNPGTTDIREIAIEQALKVIHVQAGLFLTIPFNVHVNIPKVEWLYGGIGVEIHIPVSDAGLDSLIGADITKYFPGGSIKGKTFVSMPIDFGFDFSRIKSNGKPSMSRLLFRAEPEFFENGMMSVPVSLIWQSSLWKLASAPIPRKQQAE